jgi:hypothetical protein
VSPVNPSKHPDEASEDEAFRHEAIQGVVEAYRQVGDAKKQLGVAERRLRAAMEHAVGGAGVKQADIARLLGWDRRQVNATLRTNR